MSERTSHKTHWLWCLTRAQCLPSLTDEPEEDEEGAAVHLPSKAHAQASIAFGREYLILTSRGRRNRACTKAFFEFISNAVTRRTFQIPIEKGNPGKRPGNLLGPVFLKLKPSLHQHAGICPIHSVGKQLAKSKLHVVHIHTG